MADYFSTGSMFARAEHISNFMFALQRNNNWPAPEDYVSKDQAELRARVRSRTTEDLLKVYEGLIGVGYMAFVRQDIFKSIETEFTLDLPIIYQHVLRVALRGNNLDQISEVLNDIWSGVEKGLFDREKAIEISSIS